LKAAQFVGKPLFEVNEVADPVCPAGGLLVRVDSTAICGTDLKIMECRDVKIKKGKVTSMEFPRITGHELSGIVEQVGGEVEHFKCGDQLVVAPTIPCLRCTMCGNGYHEMCDEVQVIGYHRDGGFAELIRLDADVLAAGCAVKVPENVSLEEAALTEPLSCVVNCFELSAVTGGGSVLILGAGPLGLMMADLAAYLGAKQVMLADISSEQLEKSRASKADVAIDMASENIEERIDELTGGLGVDLAIAACSAPEAQRLALKVVAKRGSVNFFGGLPRDRSVIAVDTNLIHYKEISVVGTHGSAPRHAARAMQLQAEGAIDLRNYIDRRFALEDINKALTVARGTGRLKILIKPNW